MNTTGRENIGSCAPEFLFASSKYPVSVCHVTVKKGEKLTRGDALALNDGGKCVILGTAKATGETNTPVAAYVLAEDVDATDADTTAEAYRTGHFIKGALGLADSYTMTAADIEAYRKEGIMIDAGMSE